jgi:hypothetical protein
MEARTAQFSQKYARARARVMGSYSGGNVPIAGAEPQLSAHARPASEARSSDPHGTCIAFFRGQRPCGTADLAACERHISANTFGEASRGRPP